MSTAIVLGGGLGGLSSAYYLSKSAKFAKVVVLESSNRLGGWAHTVRHNDGTIFELGPRSFRPMGDSGKNSLQLAEEIGLSDSVIGIASDEPAAKNRYLYVNNQVHKLRTDPISLLQRCPPFGKPLAPDLALELFRKKKVTEDESIHDFVARRVSKEFADIAVNAMIRGIYAGDTHKLSIRSCLPILFNAEQKHGSIIQGILMESLQGKKEKAKIEQKLKSDLLNISRSNQWRMWSLRKGVSEFGEKLEEALNATGKVQIHRNSRCEGIDFDEDGAQVKTEKETFSGDHVISSIFARDLAMLMPEGHGRLEQLLNKITAVDVVVVNFEFEGHLIPKTGFGHLLPASEDAPILGLIYDSQTFHQHNRPGAVTTRLTLMMGGAWYSELEERLEGLTDDEDAVIKMSLDVLRQQMHITGKPTKVKVSNLKNCIPQYLVGHHVILRDMDTYIKDHALPLTLVGSSYKGVSVNDVMYNARLAVEELCQGS